MEDFKNRAEKRLKSWNNSYSSHVINRICVEGMGDWGKKTYLPAIRNAYASRVGITALYRDIHHTLLDIDLNPWEYFEKKETAWLPIQEKQDLLVVATPDTTHINILTASKNQFTKAIVEKPFCTNPDDLIQAQQLIAEGAQIWGVDHYPYYIANAFTNEDEVAKIWEYLGGECARIEFALLQSNPIELYRLDSLQLGLGYDMVSHFLAILVALGLKGDIQQLKICEAAQHSMPATTPYTAETFLDLAFKIHHTNTKKTIDCRAVVGKGLPVDVKYLDLIGMNGAMIRFDLGSLSWKQRQDYPFSKVCYLRQRNTDKTQFTEYLGSRVEHEKWHIKLGMPLDTSRPYNRLMCEMVNAKITPSTGSCLFTLEECAWIVNALKLMEVQLANFLQEHNAIWPNHALCKFPEGWNEKIWQ